MSGVINFENFLVNELEDFGDFLYGDESSELGNTLNLWVEFVTTQNYAIYNSGFRTLLEIPNFDLYFSLYFDNCKRFESSDQTITMLAVEAIEFYGSRIIALIYNKNQTIKNIKHEDLKNICEEFLQSEFC